MTDARSAIAAKSRLFEHKYNNNDPVGLVNGYFAEEVDDPMASPPGGQAPVRGRAALIGMFSAMIPEVPAIRLELIDLVDSADQAYELGRAHLVRADGVEMTGRYTACWIRRGDEWRAKVDFFAEDGWD